MSRPPDPEKRRDLALRATAVLQRAGLELPASRLAEALGINRTTLLYHFRTYGELIELALLDLLGEQAAFVQARVEQVDHPIERLLAHMHAVHDFHRERQGRILFLSQAVAATAGKRTAELFRASEAIFEAHRLTYADRLRAGMRAGTVARCDAEALVSLTRAWTDGLLFQRVVTRAPNDAAMTLAAEILRSFIRRPKHARPGEGHAQALARPR